MPLGQRHYRAYEKIAKGFASHRRIEILDALERTPNLMVFDIAEILGINFRTASEHTRKLVAAELVTKQYQGQAVHHRITPLGTTVLKFLKSLG